MRATIQLPFATRPVPATLLAVAERPSIRALPRRRPRGLRVALLAAWAVLCGVVA